MSHLTCILTNSNRVLEIRLNSNYAEQGLFEGDTLNKIFSYLGLKHEISD